MKSLNQYIKESLLCKAIYNESILDDEDELTSNSPIEIIKSFIDDNYKVAGKLDIKESNNIYVVNCDSDVRIKNDKITQLTNDFFEWGVVKGYFNCSYCDSLKDLQGAPKKVGGSFLCNCCESLKDLTGAPKKVDRNFYCYECASLTSLDGAPKEVDGDFDCYECKSLKTLQGAPEKVGGDFYCYECKIKFTEDDVKKVSKVKGKIIV